MYEIFVVCLLAFAGMAAVAAYVPTPQLAVRNAGRGRRPVAEVELRWMATSAKGYRSAPTGAPKRKGAPVDPKWVIKTHEGPITLVNGRARVVASRKWRTPLPGNLEWRILSVPFSAGADEACSLYEAGPTLGWLKDDKALALFVTRSDGHVMSHEEFAETLGLEVSGGIGRLSKRLSRIMRPQPLYRWTRPSMIETHEVGLGAVRSVSWDGINIVGRKELLRSAEWRIRAEKLPPKEASYLRAVARSARRVEITLTTKRGQAKGHAIVVPGEGFWLPKGSWKPEVKLLKRGLLQAEPRHASSLWLDRQSLVNLSVNTFFTPDRLVAWAKDLLSYRLALYDSDEAFALIDRLADGSRTREEFERLLAYPLFEFIASGGNPKWDPVMARSFLSHDLSKLLTRSRERSWPVPGVNLYVAPASLAQRRGLTVRGLDGRRRPIAPPRGSCVLDIERGTVWCHDVDIVTSDRRFKDVHDLETFCGGDPAKLEEIRKGAPGLYQIWSGADGDDMLRCLPVHLPEGDFVLTWRSPNELGQWALLKMDAASDYPEFAGGVSVAWGLDPAKLPAQTAQGSRPNAGLIGGQLFEGEYSDENLATMTRLMLKNAGAVGKVCLLYRLFVATLKRLPQTLPAETSDIIDAQVKDVKDLSKVLDWCRQASKWLASQSCEPGGSPIPLSSRYEFSPTEVGEDGQRYTLPVKFGHAWVDDFNQRLVEVVEWFAKEIEKRAKATMPPTALFEKASGYIDAGRAFRQEWGRFWKNLLREEEKDEEVTPTSTDWWEFFSPGDEEADEEAAAEREERFAAARAVCENFAARLPTEVIPLVMVGGIASEYTSPVSPDGKPRTSCFWQLGAKLEVGREPGFWHRTIEGFRMAGLIGRPRWDEKLRRPTVEHVERGDMLKKGFVTVRYLWFNLARARGRINCDRPGQVSREIAERLKKEAREILPSLIGMTVSLGVHHARAGRESWGAIFGPRGGLMGTLPRETSVTFEKAVIVSAIEGRDDEVLLLLDPIK